MLNTISEPPFAMNKAEGVPDGKSVHICQLLRRKNMSSGQGWREREEYTPNVQSSPGYLQVGHVPSNCTRQIPQTSSSGISHRQEATACHSSIVTFMVMLVQGSANISIYSIVRSTGKSHRRTKVYQGSEYTVSSFYWDGSDMLSLFVC